MKGVGTIGGCVGQLFLFQYFEGGILWVSNVYIL